MIDFAHRNQLHQQLSQQADSFYFQKQKKNARLVERVADKVWVWMMNNYPDNFMNQVEEMLILLKYCSAEWVSLAQEILQ